MKINILKLLSAIALCQLAGFIGSWFTTPAIRSWYVFLEKPDFNPPNWLFAPVWTLLFILMAISLYLVWQSTAKKKTQALIIFYLQLGLNIIWSVIFFGLKNPGLAFGEILFLWLLILLTITSFYKINKTSAYLLTPYLVWVSFAAFLNFLIWNLNR